MSSLWFLMDRTGGKLSTGDTHHHTTTVWFIFFLLVILTPSRRVSLAREKTKDGCLLGVSSAVCLG